MARSSSLPRRASPAVAGPPGTTPMWKLAARYELTRLVRLENFNSIFIISQNSFQIYHMCDGLGRQFSYACPNTTLFQQRMLICDHWYMVNCSKAESNYAANLLIGINVTGLVE